MPYNHENVEEPNRRETSLDKFVERGLLTKEDAMRIESEGSLAHCTKCGEDILGKDNELCGNCCL